MKDWYYSNGNIRAWPYSLNRGDQASPPSRKLYRDEKEDIVWLSRFLKLRTQKEINDRLLEYSFCTKEWLDLNEDIISRIKDLSATKKLIYSILHRNIALCREWYEKFDIDTLYCNMPSQSNIKEFFWKILDARMWKGSKENDDRYYYFSSLGKDNLHLYVEFDVEANTLKEDNVYFGIYSYDEAADKFLSLDIKIPKSKEETFIRYSKHVIYGAFTLISFSDISLVNLFKDFDSWLDIFPDKAIQAIAIRKFKESIRSEYRDRIFI